MWRLLRVCAVARLACVPPTCGCWTRRDDAPFRGEPFHRLITEAHETQVFAITLIFKVLTTGNVLQQGMFAIPFPSFH